MIVLYISTYALSHNVLPVIQNTRVPILVLNLQPVAAIDYEKFNAIGDRGKMTGEWLAHCQACTAPELASVFNRAGIDYHLITGYLDEPIVWEEIDEWIRAMDVVKSMRNNRAGVMGFCTLFMAVCMGGRTNECLRSTRIPGVCCRSWNSWGPRLLRP